ncbi:uncharacterized protein TRUGW13939_04385 [Talaromyces rugulosus]|uniref:Uncharacterized protein n=1 Tax=Talaromyces rugulosus TaxID=121627 RepID=A0A7H8QTG3_TALRU|nr:uncharacterized protein TRUGW13939_04385 [Talaromyces rugulosus]QKX57274.1 hypothetical protein TRUGW13939_04385 [Talaromyces rugulosus]
MSGGIATHEVARIVKKRNRAEDGVSQRVRRTRNDEDFPMTETTTNDNVTPLGGEFDKEQVSKRVRANLQKAENWTVQHPSSELVPLDKIDIESLLGHLISKVDEKFDHYNKLFESLGQDQIKRLMRFYLFDGVKKLCQEGNVHLERLVETTQSKNVGVYLLEMWMCNVFQTVPWKDLEEYTPLGSRIAWAGQHLNVALPFWQSFRDNEGSELWKEQAMGVTKEGFREFLLSADPQIRAWAESMRNSFHAIRTSPDPNHRQYDKEAMQKFHEIGVTVYHKQAIASYRRVLLGGKDCQVKINGGHVLSLFPGN